MKRLLLSILLLSLNWVVLAQSDSVATPPTVADTATWVIDSTVVKDSTVRQHKESNLYGEPIYYQNGYYADDGNFYAYQRPRRPYRTFGHHWDYFFVESEVLFGEDYATGLMLAYVPSRWGGYCSGLRGYESNWMTMGVVCRMAEPSSLIDLQLYGGLAMGLGVGGEIGIRIASNASNERSKFSWWSASASLLQVGGYGYATVGVSFGITATAALGVVLPVFLVL